MFLLYYPLRLVASLQSTSPRGRGKVTGSWKPHPAAPRPPSPKGKASSCCLLKNNAFCFLPTVRKHHEPSPVGEGGRQRGREASIVCRMRLSNGQFLQGSPTGKSAKKQSNGSLIRPLRGHHSPKGKAYDVRRLQEKIPFPANAAGGKTARRKVVPFRLDFCAVR